MSYAYIYIFINRHVHIDWITSDSPVEMWWPRVLSPKVTIFAPAVGQNGLMTSEADEKSHHGNLKRLETDQAVVPKSDAPYNSEYLVSKPMEYDVC